MSEIIYRLAVRGPEWASATSKGAPAADVLGRLAESVWFTAATVALSVAPPQSGAAILYGAAHVRLAVLDDEACERIVLRLTPSDTQAIAQVLARAAAELGEEEES